MPSEWVRLSQMLALLFIYKYAKEHGKLLSGAGRAGRDWSERTVRAAFLRDVQTARFLILNGETNEALSQEELLEVRRRDLDRLRQMEAYCKTTACLRSTLLSYFGEAAAADCENCGNCNAATIKKNITVEAQKILLRRCQS